MAKNQRAKVKSATPIAEQPDPGSAPVTTLAEGTVVTVTPSQSVMGKVEVITHDGTRGWIFKANLDM